MRLSDVSFRFPLRTLLFVWAVPTLGATGDIDECASYKNLIEQISCYTAVAKASNDWAPCDRASHEGVRYQCYSIFAEYSGSADVCHKIPPATDEHRSLIDVCLSDVAIKARNPSLCERISTPGLRDSCYVKLAKEVGDLALCAKIRDAGLKSACNGEAVIVK